MMKIIAPAPASIRREMQEMKLAIMIEFDSEQIRIIDWRMTAKDIAAVIGPPGW